MKRVNNIYNKILDIDNIIDMTNKVCRNVKNKKKVDKFEMFKSEHIINIKNRLENKDINFNKYNIFMITDPKYRIIMSQSIEDKIINHLVAKYFLSDVFENSFVDSMCATRVGKGSSYAIKLLKSYLNKLKNKYNNFYVLKIDIKKYFYNIDHNVLKSILRKKIKDKKALNLLDKIIDSTNNNYINKRIISLKNEKIEYLRKSNMTNKNKLIEEVSSIPIYKKNKGVSIGNQTSQIIGLIYLCDLMHYIKEQLHIKYVINYMDDILILYNDKDYLKFCLDEIKTKLNKEYLLDIHNKKTKINSIRNGINFIGYRFFIKNNKVIIKLGKNTKRNFKRKVKVLKLLLDNKYININEYNNYLCSYKGLLMQGNCKYLLYRYKIG